MPFYRMVTHFIFEWTIYGIISLNIIAIIVELTVTDVLTLQVLTYINYVFCFIYLLEVIVKIIGLRHYYFLSQWNLFDLAIFIVSLIDITLELVRPMDQANVAFPPAIFRVVGVLKILRVGRVLRLFKVVNLLYMY